jgi:hypothetical protein
MDNEIADFIFTLCNPALLAWFGLGLWMII